MFKFLVASLPLFCELVFYAVYGSQYSDKIFSGIPLAMPRFRDLYILILNVRCPTPVYLFSKLGSCSDSFYGLSPGQFDYPQLPFYLFNHIPNNLIGRATSVFSSLNILVRISLISIFALPFFNIEDNIRWGYMVGVIMMIISAIILIVLKKKEG